MNKAKLRIGIVEFIKDYANKYGLSIEDLADACGITLRTFYRRLHDPSSFTVDEILRIKKMLGWDIYDLAYALEGVKCE